MTSRPLVRFCLVAVLCNASACTPERPIPEKAELVKLCDRENPPIAVDEVVDRGVVSTVNIKSVHKGPGCGFYSVQGGTGVIVDQQAGLILTAAHVVEGTVKVEIATLALVDNKIEEQDSMEAIVLARDDQVDVALLMVARQHQLPPAMPLQCRWIPLAGRPVVQFGRTTKVSIGKVVRVIIHVEGNANRPVLLVETTARGEFGDSGGPVLDSSGRLVGILVMKNDLRRSSFFVPLDEAISVLEGPIKR